MLNPEKTDKNKLTAVHDRFVGTIFGLAPFLGIWFDDKEVKYIETEMMAHKLYRLVNGNVAGIKPRQDHTLFDFQREWLNGFYNDPDCPVGVKAYIHYYIGHEQADMKICDEMTGKHTYELSIAHKFLAELWMETCR